MRGACAEGKLTSPHRLCDGFIRGKRTPSHPRRVAGAATTDAGKQGGGRGGGPGGKKNRHSREAVWERSCAGGVSTTRGMGGGEIGWEGVKGSGSYSKNSPGKKERERKGKRKKRVREENTNFSF